MSNKIPLLKGQRRRKKRWYDHVDKTSADVIKIKTLDPQVNYIHPLDRGNDTP